MQTRASIRGLPLRYNFLCTAGGNMVYALCQWGMIVSIAKLTNASMVGQFALGIAVSTPILRLTNLQLRNVQASDAKQQYTFHDYLCMRLLTSAIGLFLIAGVGLWNLEQPATAMVIFAVGVAKAIEAISSIFYGLFQAHDRMDQVGLSLIIKGVVSVVCLAAGLYLTRDVFWGVLALAVGWLMVTLFFDARRSCQFLPETAEVQEKATHQNWLRLLRPRFDPATQRSLAAVAYPLGIAMGLISLNLHMPRYFVHFQLGEMELGVYSAIGYMSVSLVTVADALGHAAVPKLSRYYAERKMAKFGGLAFKLISVGAAFAAMGVGIAALAGEFILTLAYGQEYSVHNALFMWVMASGGAAVIASLLTGALTATRSFRLQIPLFAATAVVNALACYFLVPAWGIIGAAAATLVATATHVALAGGMLLFLLHSAKGLINFEELQPRRDAGTAGAAEVKRPEAGGPKGPPAEERRRVNWKCRIA